MPLFAPSVILNSNFKSKSLYNSVVTISPPAVDSDPPEAKTDSTPSLISQPDLGNSSNLAPLQPFVVFPSQSIFQPCFVSSIVKLFFVIIVAVITTNIAFSYKNDTQNSELLSIQTATQNSEVVDAENPLSTKFDEIFKDTYPANRPGASVLISKGDKIILKKGYGLADVEHNLAIKPHMTFRLGSLTKQFTAVAILMLEQEGLLKVTDDINLHLPDYPTHGKIITIENLLTHTAGIFNMTAIPGFFANTSQTEMNTEELLEIFKDLPLDFEPGTKMSYSNSGYVILGAIIEKISNKSYGTFVKERIFAPLGMNNSHYGSAINIIPHRVKGYDLTEEGFTNIEVTGMTCNHCKSSVEKNLSQLNQIEFVEADLATKTVLIKGSNIQASEIEQSINDLGFEYKGEK